MPLPDVQALQGADATQAERNPQFMQDPITSPNTTVGVPVAPQALPQPQTGTGQNNTPDSPFSADLLNKVFGQPKAARTPGNLTTMNQADAESMADRYPVFEPGSDNEEVYGLNQSPWKQAANGIIKGIGMAAGTFVQGMMSIPDMISAAASGKASDLYDSNLERGTSTLMNNMENTFPNYYTHAQQDRGILNAVPFSGGFANFWGDKMIKNLGFVAGAVGSAVAQDAIIGAVTDGIGDALLVPNQFGKAALWLNKAFVGADTAQDLLQGGKMARTLTDAGVDLSQGDLLTLKGLSAINTTKKLGSAVEYMNNIYGAGRTMSAGGAREMHDSVKQDLTQDYITKNGYAPIAEDQQKIEDTATAAANTKFAVDTGLMMVMESVSLDNILKPYGTATERYMASIQRKFGIDAEGIQFKEGSIDQVGYFGKGKQAAKSTGEKEPIITPPPGTTGAEKTTAQAFKDKVAGAFDATKQKLGQIRADIPPPSAIATSLKAGIPGVLSGGILYGAGMFASGEGVKNFYEDKFNGKIQGTLADAINKIGDGMSAAFGTKEGLEQVLIGGLLGGLMGVVGKKVEQFKRGTTPETERNAIIDLLNKNTVSGFMRNNHEAASATLGNAEKMAAAVKAGDVYEYENLKHQEFANFVINHAKNNMSDIGMEKLRLLKELPDEQFKQMWGMDPSDATRRTASEYVDDLMDQYKKITKSRDLISKTFSNPFDYRQKPRTDDEREENERHTIFGNFQDTLASYASVGKNVADRVRAMSKQATGIYPLADPITLSDLTRPSGLSDYNKELKAKASEIEQGLKDDTTIARAADRVHLNFLNGLTKEVDGILAKVPAGNKHQAYSSLADLSTFEKLLNYKAHGQDYSTSENQTFPAGKLPSDELVPKESLVDLATYGGDINKLNIAAQGARTAYDYLASPKGFEDFYNQYKATQAAYTPPPEEPIIKGGLGGVPGQTAPETPDTSITVINPYSKATHSYNAGDPIYIPQDKGNPLKATVVAKNTDGSITVQYDDAEKTQEAIQPKDLFKQTTQGEKVTKVNKTAPTVVQTEPVEATPEQVELVNPTEDQKPNILPGIFSTSSPTYNTPDLDDNNFHQRVQNFAYDMGSYDPKVFNQENRAKLKIMDVTAATQEQLGFKPNWIETTTGQGIDPKTSIRGVLIISDDTGNYFADSKGDKMGKVGETVDPSKAIYTQYRDSNLKNEKGIEKYTNKNKEDTNAISKWWEGERQKALASKNPQLRRFTVSRGIYRTNTGVRNSVLKVGLINEADLGKDLIDIPSVNSVILPKPIVNAAGEGIETTKEEIPFKAGNTLLNHGGNVIFLNNPRFSPEQAEKVFSLLSHYSDANTGLEEKEKTYQYLKSLIYTVGGVSKAKSTPRNIAIRDVDDKSFLYLGQSVTPIELNVASLEDNKPEILKFLQEQAFHNIDLKELNKIKNSPKDAEKLKYDEYEVKEGKLTSVKQWPNYNHYLLSDEGGRTPILTTNLAIPQDGERPITQKYFTPKGFDTPEFVKTEAAVPTAATPTVNKEVKKKIAYQGIKAGDRKLTFEYEPKVDEAGNVIGVDKLLGYREEGSEELKQPKTPEKAIAKLEELLRQNEIPQDTSVVKDIPGLGDPSITFDAGAQTSFMQILPNSYTKIDISKEVAEAKRMLGEDTPIEVLDHVLKMTNGGRAWGAFVNNTIYIWNQAKEGTGYHEVFEKVFNTFLNGKQQADLYYEFQNREGKFKTYLGEDKDYSEASFKEAKEKIADEFADFKTTGKGNIPPKQKSFFRRLIDFIKRILFGNRDAINNLFDKINREEYRQGSHKGESDGTLEPQYSRIGLDNVSEAFIQDTLQGMTSEMFSDIFGSNKQIISLLEDRPEQASKDIYKRLFDKLASFYEPDTSGNTLFALMNEKTLGASNLEQKEFIKGQLLGYRDGWNYIKSNWPAIVAEHKNSLSSLNIRFTTDEEGNTNLENIYKDEEENQRGMKDYDNDMLEYNAKRSAPTIIKLLYNTIAHSKFTGNPAVPGEVTPDRENSLVALPKLADYSRIFNYSLHQSANLNGLTDIWPKLLALANDPSRPINADLRKLLNRVDYTEKFKGKSIADSNLTLAFENVLTKMRPNFVRQRIKPETGELLFYTNIVNGKARELKDDWMAKMSNSGLVTTSKDGQSLIFKDNIDYKQPNIDFANKLGIDITKPDFDKLTPGIRHNINEEVSAIKGVIQTFAKESKQVGILSGKSLDFDTRLEHLADLVVTHITGDDTESQHLNLEGKPTTNFTLNSAFSTFYNDGNASKDIEEFLQRQPHMNDIFHRDSLALKKMFGKEGKYDRPIEMAVVEGRQQDGNNVSTSKLSVNERLVYEIGNNLHGVYYTVLPADGKNEWAVSFGHFINPYTFFNKDSRTRAFSQFVEIMKGYLNTEIALAKDFKDNEARRNILYLHNKLGDRKTGNSLRFFHFLLPGEKLTKLYKDVIDGNDSLESVLSDEEFHTIMKDHILKRANSVIKTLTDGRIFGTNGSGDYKLNGIVTDFQGEHLSKTRDYHPSADVIRLMSFREMNYIIAGIEQHKTAIGDPAQFNNDELKRVKSFLSGTEYVHIDNDPENGFNKNTGEQLNLAHGSIPLEPTDPGYTVWKDYANGITVRDIITSSENLEAYEKVLGKDVAAPYSEGNEADAQSWYFPTHYRELLYKSGARFTSRQEAAFQWHMAYERQKEEEKGHYKYTNPSLQKADEKLMRDQPFPHTGVDFPILKPLIAGMEYKNGVAVSSLYKTSGGPMFYQWVEDRQQVDAYRAMRTYGIDYMAVVSAHKVGIQKDGLVDLYNADGGVNIEGIGNSTPEQIPHSAIGIQVEQQTKTGGNTEGTQLKALVPQNLLSNGVPVDYIEKYKGDEPNAKADWDKLTDIQKRKQSPIQDALDRHTRILEELADKRVNLLFNRFGITENPDGSLEFPDKRKIAQYASRELKRREMPENMAKSLAVGPDGQFLIPLESSARAKEFRNILYSLVNKTILRPKINGGPKTLLANTMWEKEHRIFTKDINGKQVLVSNDLKSYTQAADGKTNVCEVYLPYWFGEKCRNILQDTNNFKGEKEFHAHLLNYLNHTKEGQELLSGIGFRIPTEGDNSIEIFKCKDFLPPQMGDAAVFPSDITVKSGSDFDIDKINTYLRNFYIGGEGYPRKIKFEKIDTNNEQALKDFYERVYLEDRREYEQYIREKKDPFISLIDQASDNSLEDEEPDYVPTLDQFIEQSKGKSPYQYNSVRALENEYIDSIHEIMTMKEKFKGLITPNDTSELQEISREIVRDSNPEYASSSKENNYGNLIDSEFMVKKRDSYLKAKKGIGVSASSQVSHAIFQMIPVLIGKDITFRLPHNTAAGTPSMSGIYAKNGSVIAKTISQVTSGFADVAKNEFLPDMGINNDTAKNFIIPVRLGMDPRAVEFFNNQPAVKEYLRLKDIYRNVPSINREVRPKGSDQIFEEVAKSFGGLKSRASLQAGKPTSYPVSGMKDMLQKYSQGKSLNRNENLMQMQILDDYLQTDSMAWDIFRYNQGYNWATDRLADPNLVRRKLLLYEAAQDLGVTAASNVMKKTYIGNYMENVIRMDDAYRAIFTTQSGPSSWVLDNYTRDLLKRKRLNRDDFAFMMGKVDAALIDSIVQSKIYAPGTSTPLNTYILPLTTGEGSTARWIKAIQDSKDQTLKSNPFIANLRVTIDPRPGYPHKIELKQKAYDTYTSNVLTGAMRDLRDDGTVITKGDETKQVGDIYKRLLLTGIIQSGTQNTPRSFNSLIPVEDYSKIVGDVGSKIGEDVRTFYSNDGLYRANWLNDQFVPIIAKRYYDDPRTGSLELKSNEIQSEDFRKLLNTKEPVSIIALHGGVYSDKVAVKSVDYIRDPVSKKITDSIVRLYKRVDVADNPAIIVTMEMGEGGKPYPVKKAVFKEINKWGAQGVQEYYNDRIESILPSNPKVEELTDERIIQALIDSKINTPKDGALANYTGEVPDAIGEDIGEPDGKSPGDIIKNLQDKGIIKRDC